MKSDIYFVLSKGDANAMNIEKILTNKADQIRLRELLKRNGEPTSNVLRDWAYTYEDMPLLAKFAERYKTQTLYL